MSQRMRGPSLSYDWGSSWKIVELDLPTDKWIPYLTLMDPESSTQRMLLFAINPDDRDIGWMVQLDFTEVKKRQCYFDPSQPQVSADFEEWKPTGAKGQCLLGQSFSYYRRKPTSDCYVGQDFGLPQTQLTSCECTEEDYECDVDFVRVGNECLPSPQQRLHDKPISCPAGTKYQAKSGFRKVPGNKCQGGIQKQEWVERDCGTDAEVPTGSPKIEKPPSEGSPGAYSFTPGSRALQIHYVKDSNVVFLRTESGTVWRSPDEGKTWKKMSDLEIKGQVSWMEEHPLNLSKILFYTNKEIYYIEDATKSENLVNMSLPGVLNIFGVPVLDYHPTHPDWYIFTGNDPDCDTSCHTEVFMSTDNAKNWKKIETWTEKCVWARDARFQNEALDDDAVYCLSYMYKDGQVSQDKLRFAESKEKNSLQFVLINNHGSGHIVVYEKDVLGFFVVSNVLVVAAKVNGSARLFVSSDGLKLEEARFPPKISLSDNVSRIVKECRSAGL
jgi:hypothetical protein